MDKKYDHLTGEQKARELWKDNSIYSFEKSNKNEIFSIDTPPPTVSGTLHIGHVYSYTHTDIIARYKRMRGYNVFYPMGFDDNGLATERFVEKTHSVRGSQMKRSEFIELCLKTSHEAEQTFEELWTRLGLSIDWSKTYSTINEKVRKISQYSFIDLYKKGLIYRKEEPALYCTACRTTVAQAELESVEHPSIFNTITFDTQTGEQLSIATTRPELLPACVAIFYHPDDARYQHLQGKNALTPIFNKTVPILADKAVNPEKGTGLVMCCTFGDQTDIVWFKTHRLPFIQAIGFDGKMTPQTEALAGLKVPEARKKIIELLQEQNRITEQKNITHHVSVHERCKTDIEYLILSQWFINILDKKQTFIDLGDQIKWTPEFMKSRYKDWVTNLGWDWCISRQRFYGIPFPVWHCVDCKEILLADVNQLPIDPQEQPYKGCCPKCSSSNLRPETDVMDTWNTSSLTPQINAHWPDEAQFPIPMSMRPQAHDIIRTWAFDTIVKSHYHQNTIPWKDIVISGHVLSDKGKISKSQGGAKMTPEFLLDNYSADVIRYWTAQGKPGMDITFAETQLKIGLRLTTKLWNAFLFCEEHIKGYQPSETQITNPLNQWLLFHFHQTMKSYIKYFEQYDYHLALESVEKFFWHHFCDNYIEFIKDQLFNPSKYDEQTINETRFTLYTIGYGLLQAFAPFMPYITELLYQELYRKNNDAVSLHLTQLNPDLFAVGTQENAEFMDTVIDIVCHVRKAKSEHKLSLAAPVATLYICSADSSKLKNIMTQDTLIRGVTKADKIELSNETIVGAMVTIENEKVTIKVGV